MIVDVKLVGLTELQARLDEMPQSVWARLAVGMHDIVEALAEAVRGRMAALFKNPERMQASVSTFVDEAPPVTGTVMASGLPYLAIQEYGGVTSPHDIFPVNAQVLAFMMPGAVPFKAGASNEMVFARHVSHPGSNIPERSYARSALAMEKGNIIAALRELVGQGATVH